MLVVIERVVISKIVVITKVVTAKVTWDSVIRVTSFSAV
jgi:hypothetical protein